MGFKKRVIWTDTPDISISIKDLAGINSVSVDYAKQHEEALRNDECEHWLKMEQQTMDYLFGNYSKSVLIGYEREGETVFRVHRIVEMKDVLKRYFERTTITVEPCDYTHHYEFIIRKTGSENTKEDSFYYVYLLPDDVRLATIQNILWKYYFGRISLFQAVTRLRDHLKSPACQLLKLYQWK